VYSPRGIIYVCSTSYNVLVWSPRYNIIIFHEKMAHRSACTLQYTLYYYYIVAQTVPSHKRKTPSGVMIIKNEQNIATASHYLHNIISASYIRASHSREHVALKRSSVVAVRAVRWNKKISHQLLCNNNTISGDKKWITGGPSFFRSGSSSEHAPRRVYATHRRIFFIVHFYFILYTRTYDV